MSEFNQCANLVDSEALQKAQALYHNLLRAGKDPQQYLLNLQNSLQERVAKEHGRVQAPKEIKTKGELYDFVHDQKVAIDDEWREMVEAMAGMSLPEKDRSALWKKWKGKYTDIRSESIASLSDEDRIELEMEIIDISHFFNNVLLAMNIDAEKHFVYYALKNMENINRQNRGY